VLYFVQLLWISRDKKVVSVFITFAVRRFTAIAVASRVQAWLAACLSVGSVEATVAV
jgi:hypothetical protein